MDTKRSKESNYLLNAMGPYTHGVWENGYLKIGDEEALQGRAGHIIDVFVRTIKERYSDAEIRQMSLVDVGCYDGFLTLNIESRLPFKRIVGIEPRMKNIEKGQTVRNYLGIQTQCEFSVGDIDSLAAGSEKFDIVFCSGVFHHLIEIDSAVKKFKKSCRKTIFIETQCYEPLPKNKFLLYFYNKKNERIIEPKDIVYKFVPKCYGISGHKFETNYYDGSASGFSLVNIPSPDAVCMSLRSNGFTNVQIASHPYDYKKSIKSNLREFFAVCVCADNNSENNIDSEINNYIEAYERSVLSTLLPSALLKNLEHFIFGGTSAQFGIYYFIAAFNRKKYNRFFNFFIRNLTNRFLKNPYELEILANIKYRPVDKLRIELAKQSIATKKEDKAITDLLDLVGKINTDWRVSYRAFCLLALLYKKAGNSEREKYFRDLCITANGNYPQAILDGTISSIFKD